jgi:hypothetical protein
VKRVLFFIFGVSLVSFFPGLGLAQNCPTRGEYRPYSGGGNPRANVTIEQSCKKADGTFSIKFVEESRISRNDNGKLIYNDDSPVYQCRGNKCSKSYESSRCRSSKAFDCPHHVHIIFDLITESGFITALVVDSKSTFFGELRYDLDPTAF